MEEAKHFQSIGWTAHKIHPHGEPKMDIKISQEKPFRHDQIAQISESIREENDADGQSV